MKQLRPYQQEVLDTLRVRLKETNYPLLVNASVGAGKSLIIAELLRIVERAGWRALCLTMNSTLIHQNAETYMNQGGNAGIFCASLGMKDSGEPIIFASPMSVRGSIKNNGKLSKVPFNLIIVDECHNINVNERGTSYMRIFNHYSIYAQANGHKLRFVGLTGTPYRGKGHTIVGEDLFFKEEVCAITAEWLIQENYLTQPIWGYCDKTLQYDFRQLKTNSMGKFSGVDLEEAIHKQPRLTGKIMAEVSEIVKDRVGAFIFASSVKHCYECAESLPPTQTAVITGDTPDKLREQYITQSRAGIIKYLVNVNVLCTGVDIPIFDTVVFVRPTESLVLYMQCLGRGLRLADGKTDCLILDYAGNLERHGDIDNPVINEALKPKHNDPEYCIECFDCGEFNTLMARRCIGTPNDQRCEHWFEWKDCPSCGEKNDIVSRQCRSCEGELLDPNRNLNKEAAARDYIELKVVASKYWVINRSVPVFCAKYKAYHEKSGRTLVLGESYILRSKLSKDIFYSKFVKDQFKYPTYSYRCLGNEDHLNAIIDSGEVATPDSLIAKRKDDGTFRIHKKLFT